MRRPNLARRLAIDPTPGLSNLLVGLCREEDVVQDVGLLENLKVITSGDVPPNPSELLGSERMSTVVSALSQNFDFIIFDLPPVNAVSDGLVISRLIQGMIVVVRQDYSNRHDPRQRLRRPLRAVWPVWAIWPLRQLWLWSGNARRPVSGKEARCLGKAPEEK